MDNNSLYRFWSKVSKGDGCWEWLSAKTTKGYGMFWFGGKSLLAHRVAYELEVGTIPDGFELDHSCHNHSCVNPAHLSPMDPRQNRKRKLFLIYCPHGHLYTPENTYQRRNGYKYCKQCRREQQRTKETENVLA